MSESLKAWRRYSSASQGGHLIRPRLVGHPRAFPVLDEKRIVDIGTTEWTVKQLASKYKPIIRQKSTWHNQPLRMTYEIIDEETRYIIRYHVVWLDEIHPSPLVNLVYRQFRILYYGSALDIEMIEVSVDKTSGHTSKVVFETEPEKGSDLIPSHTKAILSRINHKYAMMIGDRQPIEVLPTFHNDRIEFLASSWNHEFAIQFSRSDTRLFDLPLEFLNEREYASLRYETRRQASAKSFHKLGTQIVLMCWFFLSPFVVFLALLRRKG